MPTDKCSWVSDGQLIRRGDTEGAGLGDLDLVREVRYLESLSHFLGFCFCLSILNTSLSVSVYEISKVEPIPGATEYCRLYQCPLWGVTGPYNCSICMQFIVLYLQPVLNPKSYDGARVLEASGRPMFSLHAVYAGFTVCTDRRRTCITAFCLIDVCFLFDIFLLFSRYAHFVGTEVIRKKTDLSPRISVPVKAVHCFFFVFFTSSTHTHLFGMMRKPCTVNQP